MAPTGCKRTVSGTISLPCSGYFSPFPHGTGSLSVSQKYLALPDGPGSFNQDFSCPDLLRIPIILLILTCTGLSPSMVWLSRHIPFHINNNITGPSTPTTPKRYRFGLFPVRSPLLRESLLFSFPPGTKMFQFSGLAPRKTWYYDFIIVGCPIRKSTDISDICSSPLLIAACHVLHRLWEPRHSPCALIYFLELILNFTNFFSNTSKNFISSVFKV